MTTSPLDDNEIILPFKLRELKVIQWCSRPVFDRAEQVHLFIRTIAPGFAPEKTRMKIAFFLRFKTAQSLDRFIEMMIHHREEVWGRWQRNIVLQEDWDFEE